jgi:3-hydroxyacyl-CoA dehydrogenase
MIFLETEKRLFLFIIFVASHTNIVIGLVETIVGLIPAGGGCKEMLWRWSQTDEAKKDPDFAPLKAFDIIGYAKTATSPVEAEPYKFLKSEDKKIMNRNSLSAAFKYFKGSASTGEVAVFA